MHSLPFQTIKLPGVGGAIGGEPEHFIVDEIPLYQAVGNGEHWYARLRKRLRTTQELLKAVARATRVRERDIGYAGLKDKHAITTQWLSLPHTAPSPETWQLGPDFEVLEFSRHTNKLRTGHLQANRFRITLLGVITEAELYASRIREELLCLGLLNYFGAQRFGHTGQNLSQALHWLRVPESARRSRFDTKFLPSVIQSEIFNRYLALRVGEGFGRLLQGEVVRLQGSKSHFRIEDPIVEAPRLATRDIWLTGPMVGPRTLQATASALELEQRALAELSLSEQELTRLGELAPGARRDLVVPVEDFTVSAEIPGQLVLAFTLPSGAYATQLVREFTRETARLPTQATPMSDQLA